MSIIQWKETNGRIECFLNEQKIFSDSCDHYQNAICRLLCIDDETARAWIESCYRNSAKKFTCQILIECTKKFFKEDKFPKEINPKEIIYSKSVEGSKDFEIIGSFEEKHATLRYTGSNEIAEPPKYEKDYFEHRTASRVGYKNLLEQSDWRIEKSNRYFNKINEILKTNGFKLKKNGSVLDIGSGYGFMRLPYENEGFKTHGIELSKFAAKIAKKKFRLETHVGEFSDFNALNEYELILAYDIIEHIRKPRQFISKCFSILSKNGFMVIRTPNLFSLEASAFGERFYSFKREHLQYFSIESLALMLMDYNFKIVDVSTISHIFSGFSGIDFASLEKSGLGGDIFCIAIKL
jgi:2-polyprenyl-3-methyl-5-hydroxy-6-metoxy-1,4-benzoquinol methylase